MYMYIYMYMYTYMHMCVMRICVCMCIYIDVYEICIGICIAYVCVCVCLTIVGFYIYICMYVFHTYRYTYVNIYIYNYIYIFSSFIGFFTTHISLHPSWGGIRTFAHAILLWGMGCSQGPQNWELGTSGCEVLYYSNPPKKIEVDKIVLRNNDILKKWWLTFFVWRFIPISDRTSARPNWAPQRPRRCLMSCEEKWSQTLTGEVLCPWNVLYGTLC